MMTLDRKHTIASWDSATECVRTDRKLELVSKGFSEWTVSDEKI